MGMGMGGMGMGGMGMGMGMGGMGMGMGKNYIFIFLNNLRRHGPLRYGRHGRHGYDGKPGRRGRRIHANDADDGVNVVRDPVSLPSGPDPRAQRNGPVAPVHRDSRSYKTHERLDGQRRDVADQKTQKHDHVGNVQTSDNLQRRIQLENRRSRRFRGVRHERRS